MTEILPHEMKFLNDMKDTLIKKRLTLASEKNEAQGPSFNWHDNPCLDAVEDEARFNNTQITKINQLINSVEITEYPSKDDIRIRLGSLVIAKTNFGIMPFIMVGQITTKTDIYEKAWAEDGLQEYKEEDLSVITISGPLGAVALNAVLGSDLSYKVGERPFNVSIEHIDQDWVLNHFSDR